MQFQRMIEVTRGDHVESIHDGAAVICDGAGRIVAQWGAPEQAIYPRSAAKMIQALPLITSGAADKAALSPRHLALACASHSGAPTHTSQVSDWLSALDLSEPDLRCGAHLPLGEAEQRALLRDDHSPGQLHNNCSGKHAGFLTLNRHLGAGPEYIEPDHPVQVAVEDAIASTTQEPTQGWAPDGCSAPNFRSSLHGIARAMAFFATAQDRDDTTSKAAQRLRDAMITHPDLVAGEGRACTALMRACKGGAALKTGAEGVYVAMLPQLGWGVALKIADGSTRAAECAVAAILSATGTLPAGSQADAWIARAVRNCRQVYTGQIRPAPGFAADLERLTA